MATLDKNMKENSMWVVKVGGSLLGSPALQKWVDVLARCTDQRLIIVPGGGIFADAARQAQAKTNISDDCAHELAVLAMDQFGLMIADMNPSLATASSECEIDERTWQHRSIIWLPSKMVLADDTIEKSWDVTSDSLAAWITHKMEAKHLILIKSDQPAAKRLSIHEVVQAGLVDTAFSQYANQPTFSSWLLNKSDYAHFEAGIHLDKLRSVATEIQLSVN
jgi:5-(aminomethyl)-3-furanmethanol phosphate kinase